MSGAREGWKYGMEGTMEYGCSNEMEGKEKEKEKKRSQPNGHGKVTEACLSQVLLQF